MFIFTFSTHFLTSNYVSSNFSFCLIAFSCYMPVAALVSLSSCDCFWLRVYVYACIYIYIISVRHDTHFSHRRRYKFIFNPLTYFHHAFLFVFVAVCEKRIAARKLLLDSLVTLVCYAKLRVADPLHWLCVTTLCELAADWRRLLTSAPSSLVQQLSCSNFALTNTHYDNVVSQR